MGGFGQILCGFYDKDLDHDPARSVKMAQKVAKNGEKKRQKQNSWCSFPSLWRETFSILVDETHDVHFLHCDVWHFRFWSTKPIRWFQMVWRKTRFLAVFGQFWPILAIFGVFGHIFYTMFLQLLVLLHCVHHKNAIFMMFWCCFLVMLAAHCPVFSSKMTLKMVIFIGLF